MKITRTVVTFLTLAATANQAQAVTVFQLSRACGTDGKTYCPKVSYGKPMQACLNSHIQQIAPACKALIIKLNNGERVTFF
jgi:hypothetical protein